MGRMDKQKIAKETLEITRKEFYLKDDEEVKLDLSYEKAEEVLVVSPEMVRDFVEQQSAILKQSGGKAGTIRVVNMDSFEAAGACKNSGNKVLVMNFANAHHPGGGFLNGASAQEESLCRNSTLFTSINSQKAQVMYQYNNANPDSFDSDYMLISPNVDVFRDCNCNVLDDPFTISVLTVPAPNKNGLAKGIEQNKLDNVMKDKIRKILLVSMKYGYETIVLGAWGCGAFGHDAEKIAVCFKEILIEENYMQCFEKIVFAVYDTSKDLYNFKSFQKTFDSQRKKEKVQAEMYFVRYPFPAVSIGDFEYENDHNYKVGRDLGYRYGVLNDGRPFIAELVYRKEYDQKMIVMVMSAVGFKFYDDEPQAIDEKTQRKRITSP